MSGPRTVTARRLGAVTLSGTLLLAGTPAALATTATPAQVRRLAGQAASGDTASLTRLRAVSDVDGRSVNLADALSGASSGQLRRRLQTLALGRPSPAGASKVHDGATARRLAAALLSASRYHRNPVVSPLSRVLNELARLLSRLAKVTPGGAGALWGIFGVIALVVLALSARHSIHRRMTLPSARSQAVDGAPDPQALVAQAEQAEARGAFAEAVRLRFRAGLLQLADRYAIDYRPATLTRDISTMLGSPEFDAVAGRFERITYGQEPATAEDARASRESWRRLLSRRHRDMLEEGAA